MNMNNQNDTLKSTKKVWMKPELKYVGHVGDVLQGGGGKLSLPYADQGDSRMPTGQYKKCGYSDC
jgi:hypothetical protein